MDCTGIRFHMQDFITGKLNESEAVDIKSHIQSCDKCRAEYRYLKDTLHFIQDNTYNVLVPEALTENLKKRISDFQDTLPEGELSIAERAFPPGNVKIFLRLSKRKTPRIALIIAAIFVIFLGIILFSDNEIKDVLSIGNAKLRNASTIEELMDSGYGDELNISKENNSVRITLERIAADDYNTLISYRIENIAKNNTFIPDPSKINVEGTLNALQSLPPEMRYAMLDLTCNEPYTHRGILRLEPIAAKKGTIKIGFYGLLVKGSQGYMDGSWIFDIPVTKGDAVTCTVNKELPFDGNRLLINEIIFSKTATILKCRLSTNMNPSYMVNDIFNISLSKGDKEYKLSPYNELLGGGNPLGSYSMDDGGWATATREFDPVYPASPKEITVNLKGILYLVENLQEFHIDMNKTFPQTFQYMGSSISLDNINLYGDSAQIDISRSDEPKDIVAYNLRFGINGAKDNQTDQYPASNDGYITDKNGNREIQKLPEALRKLEEPRIFISKIHYMILKNQNAPMETPQLKEIVPEKLIVEGYYGIKYINQSLKVDLK